jgi:hypothetical protein
MSIYFTVAKTSIAAMISLGFPAQYLLIFQINLTLIVHLFCQITKLVPDLIISLETGPILFQILSLVILSFIYIGFVPHVQQFLLFALNYV